MGVTQIAIPAAKELIAEGRTQRETADILGVGLATVNRAVNDDVPDETPGVANGAETKVDGGVDVPNGTSYDDTQDHITDLRAEYERREQMICVVGKIPQVTTIIALKSVLVMVVLGKIPQLRRRIFWG